MGRSTAQLTNLLQLCIDNKNHLRGKLLHCLLLRSDLSNNTFLLNRLIELYSKCGDVVSARRVFDIMPQKGMYSWNAMLSAYSRASNLHHTWKLFSEMPERNIISWNILITTLVKLRSEAEALDVYHKMISLGYIPTRFTLASALAAYGSTMDLSYGRRCHGLAIKTGLDKNSYVSNAILCMYGKCVSISDAIEAFGDVSQPNEVSFTTMIGALLEGNKREEAIELFRFMRRNGVLTDSVTLSSIVGAFTHGDELASHNWFMQQVHGLTIKLGFKDDLHFCNSLLDVYAKSGNMQISEMIFGNMIGVSNVTFNVMIAGYGQKSDMKMSFHYFEMMQSLGLEPDEVTHINMLAACIRSGNITTARQVFDKMTCPSLSSWNAMLSGYSQGENHNEALNLFRVMQERNILYDRTTLAIVLSLSAGMCFLEGGRQVHAASVRTLLNTDIYIASGLISVYSKYGKTEMAKKIFYSLPKSDIVCWNSLIAGSSCASLDSEAFNFFSHMRFEGIIPTEFSYSTILGCCAKICSLSQGRQIHGQVVKDGYASDFFVGSGIIDLYSRCGEINQAVQFFEMMPEKNTITYNQMIHGLAQNGRGEKAVHLYQEMMISSVKPDGITFITVLTACSYAGLDDLGIKIFNSIHTDHGEDVLVEHYTCIIDCLARSGRFNELEVFIDEMPYKDDPVVWEALLSACRIHSNVAMATKACRELIRINPQNSALYLLLSNTLSSLGRWDDATSARELMSCRDLVKTPGYSWIEHSNEFQISIA